MMKLVINLATFLLISGTSLAQHPAQPEIDCLATNIYWEARNQPVSGMIAVAAVTRNRVFNPAYPSTYCSVITQGPIIESWRTRKDKSLPNYRREYYPVRHRCQFSWYCDGRSDDIPFKDLDIYDIAQSIARRAYWGYLKDNTNESTHYHAHYVNPDWADPTAFTVMIGDHLFYKLQ